MFNDDLIAYLQPAPNRFNPHEWRDVTGSIQDIRVEPHRFTLCANLPPGLYRCRLETQPDAFDMTTAMVPMVRVPDGQRVPIGPWDLNHIENYMAMPMARTYVNGKLKGGLWFDMPGPDQIAEGRLAADFGFEAEAGETELTLEFVERDRTRIEWGRVRFMEFRQDNRSLCPLLPKSKRRPSIYLNAAQVSVLRKRWLGDPRFAAVVQRIRDQGVGRFLDQDSDVPVACLIALLTNDKEIVQKAKAAILEQCRLPAWSGRPDPLLMGGENDRQMGLRLLYTALAWDWLQSLWTKDEKRIILAKAREYLQKMYDFTVLQRAYMGHPTSEPHSLGAWDGAAVACMAFYHELPIARKALPFFHGLFCDSLKLFPSGGKMAWVTFFPFFMMRYLAAANTFGGLRPELNQSPFLDNLGRAMHTCFLTPNSQELQRGLRTVEHRCLTAFLCRFHPTPGIEAIYQAFVEQEKKTAGDVKLGLFDLLYAPAKPVKPAPFPTAPLYARDIGDIIGTARGRKTIGFSLGAGLKGGSKASFTLMPHNREYVMPMASLEVSVDGAPVLININMGTYGLNSSLTNTMCFEDGGMLTQGQYLNGNVGPENSAYLRRVFLNERFIYAHAVISGTLHPRLEVQRAERILVVDLQTGAIVLADSFAGAKPIRFATHLHCSGSVTDLGDDRFRLTGGQANLIAGIKGGSKGMSDEEKGEFFVSVLNAGAASRVIVEEPTWIPAYIYGINSTGKEDISEARYPHYRRWRLEANKPVTSGSFLLALSAEEGTVTMQKDRIALPQNAAIILNSDQPIRALGCECVAEAALVDEAAQKLVLIGARQLTTGKRLISFVVPTDVELNLADGKWQGCLFSNSPHCVAQTNGVRVTHWRLEDQNSRSSCNWVAKLGAGVTA